MTQSALINYHEISDLQEECVRDGLLRQMPYETYYDSFPHEKLQVFMVKSGYYILPTVELVNYIHSRLIGKAIEIGAGNGCLGRSLKIPITDSKAQEREDLVALYAAVNQSVVSYGPDVETLSAIQAVNKLKPDTVVGAFVTHKWEPGMSNGFEFGVNFRHVYEKVRRIILVGNKVTHAANPLMKIKHEEIYKPWIVTRAFDQSQNRIFIWTR